MSKIKLSRCFGKLIWGNDLFEKIDQNKKDFDVLKKGARFFVGTVKGSASQKVYEPLL